MKPTITLNDPSQDPDINTMQLAVNSLALADLNPQLVAWIQMVQKKVAALERRVMAAEKMLETLKKT